MERCCGITKKGVRCKRWTYIKNTSYGVRLPVCSFHNEHNVIKEWSHMSPTAEDFPRDIRMYLDMYWGLATNLPFVRNVPLVMLTSYTFLKDKKQGTDDGYTLRDNFYEDIFKNKPIDDDCPVCYERTQEIETGCKHSFCRECVYTWCDMRGTCPMCRDQFFKIF